MTGALVRGMVADIVDYLVVESLRDEAAKSWGVYDHVIDNVINIEEYRVTNINVYIFET